MTVGPLVFEEEASKISARLTIKHEAKHVWQEIRIRDDNPIDNIWRLLWVYDKNNNKNFSADFAEVEAHFGSLMDNRASWHILFEEGDIYFFYKHYTNATSSLSKIADTQTRVAAREFLQDIYLQIPFPEMKDPEFQFSIRPPQ